MSNALNNLPPELQERIASIMAQGQAAPPTAPAVPQNAPQERAVAKPPSLVDHIVALRQQVDALQQQVAAQSQVIDAVGQAVGQIYALFHQTPQADAQGQTYSESFQASVDDDY